MGLMTNTSLHLTRSSESIRWHARLGHVNLKTMRSIIQRKLVLGILSMKIEKEVCESCLKAKLARRVFPQATQYRASKKLQLIHGDLCGPINPSTQAGKSYIFVLIDDYSRYMWTILLKDKSEAITKFKKLKILTEK